MEGAPPPRKKARAICGSCGAEEAKYRCPACAARSCSLPCVRKHKEASGCTGVRKRTEYRKMRDMDDALLYGDFFFLEEVTRAREAAVRQARELGGKDSRAAERKTKEQAETDQLRASVAALPRRWQALVCAAAERGCRLQLQPRGMELAQRNRSIFRFDSRKLSWTVDWLLLPAAATALTQALRWPHETCISEDDVLLEVLQARLAAIAAGSALKLRQIARSMRDESAGVTLLMAQVPSPAARPLYHRLPADATLRSALRGRGCREFPQIYVALSSSLQLFAESKEEECERDEKAQSAAKQLEGMLEAVQSRSKGKRRQRKPKKRKREEVQVESPAGGAAVEEGKSDDS